MVPDSNSSVVPQADHLTVFFASQTGNAESISRSIHEQAQERGFKSGHYVLNDHAKVDWEKEECLVFVVSTTGDGDPPDNSTKFWRHLRKLKGTGLTKAKYAILGLGDTNYDNFCQTAKRLDTKLQELGASPFYPRGLADDATGLEETVDPWIKNIWPALAHQVVSTPTIHDLPKPHLTVEETKIVKEIIEHKSQTTAPSSTPKTAATSAIVIGSYDNHPVAPPVESLSRRMDVLSVSSPTARIEPAAGNTIRIDFSSMANHSNLTALPRVPNANLIITQHETAPPAGSNPCNVPSFIQAPTPLFSAKINSVQCLTPDDALKRTLSIEFGFDDDVEYAPGDSFGIWAPNDESLVRGVLSTLGVKDEDLNKPVKLEGEGIPSHLQPIQSASLLDIFRYAVDLTTSTKKANIRLFADHATDLAEKQKLMFMSSKQGADLFNELRAQGPTLLDILHTFPSVKIPVARVIEALPWPRTVTIGGHAHLMWCSMNCQLESNDEGSGLSSIRVPMFIKPNETKFNLPVDTTKPVIMIGPGTGVAPFMGFLEHRAEQRRIKKRLVNIGSGSRQHLDDLFGEMWLFFGCRHRDRDWLFRQQMEEYRSDGVLTQLHVAVSREEDVPNSAKYVQDLIRKESKKVWDLLHRKSALIYVCGDAKGMAKSVHDELLALLIEHGGYEKMAAIMELNKWAQEKRYLRDLWA
ncbi:hypothetical protein CPC16_002541 [Podila verticillata]|nr:hypothetical protein CPC16_002541 [Podila verticillata]